MRAWRRHLPAWAGVMALGGAATLGLVVTPGWRDDTARADQALRQRASLAAPAVRRPAPAPADLRLAQALPPAALLPQRISALVRLAQQHGVQIDSARQAPPLRLGQGAAALAADRVPLRLAGSAAYTAWRSFTAQALQQDDALVLSDLRLSRNGPADRTLTGTLQWSLLQQRADGNTAALAAASAGSP